MCSYDTEFSAEERRALKMDEQRKKCEGRDGDVMNPELPLNPREVGWVP